MKQKVIKFNYYKKIMKNLTIYRYHTLKISNHKNNKHTYLLSEKNKWIKKVMKGTQKLQFDVRIIVGARVACLLVAWLLETSPVKLYTYNYIT